MRFEGERSKKIVCKRLKLNEKIITDINKLNPAELDKKQNKMNEVTLGLYEIALPP